LALELLPLLFALRLVVALALLLLPFELRLLLAVEPRLAVVFGRALP